MANTERGRAGGGEAADADPEVEGEKGEHGGEAMSGRYVVRIGGSKRDALYVVRLDDKKTETVAMQSSATRFDSSDEAREVVREMIARADPWGSRARPVRLIERKAGVL